MVLITVPQEVYQLLLDRCGIVLVTAQTGFSSSPCVVLTRAADWVYGPGSSERRNGPTCSRAPIQILGYRQTVKASGFDPDMCRFESCYPNQTLLYRTPKIHPNTRLVSTVLHFHLDLISFISCAPGGLIV